MRVLLTHTEEAFHNYYGARALAALTAHGEVVRNVSGGVLEGEALVQAAVGVDVVVADRATAVGAGFFAGARGVRAVCRVAVDVSTIDVAAATAHGVLVTRATPGFVVAVAELGVGLMIDLARGITGYAGAFRGGALPCPVPGRQLAGAVLGVIGYGAIGRHLVGLGQALGMRVVVCDPAGAPEGMAVSAFWACCLVCQRLPTFRVLAGNVCSR